MTPLGWRASLGWAIVIAAWVAGLLVVAAVTIDQAGSWRRSLEGARSQERMRWAVDDQFPPREPGTPLFDYDLAAAERGLNRQYATTLGECAVAAAVLLGAFFLVRRATPAWRRPGRRAWLLAVPIIAVAVLALGIALMAAIGGAIKG